MLLVPVAAPAQIVGPDPNLPGAAQVEGENGRVRDALHVIVTYTGDALDDVAGGVSRGIMFDGRLSLLIDSDLERAIGWKGAIAHLSVQAIQGTGLSGDRVGNLLVVSGVEARPTVRLFNIWLQQRLGGAASLRIGQYTASQEFIVSPTANLFVNSTFGWPGSFAADLPSGGPSYPLAAPAVRLAVSPTPRSTVLLAVFAGDPAGPGSAPPQSRDRYGFNGFRLSGSALALVEWQYALGSAKTAPTLKLGAWAHFGTFDDLGFDTSGRSLADPAAGPPRRLTRNAAAYAVIDGRLWADPSGRTLNAFARFSIGPSDRNEVDRYADAGLVLTGLLSRRPADELGLAIAVARISPTLAAVASDAAVSPAISAMRCETVIELTYAIKVSKAISIQPDLQYVLRPNGGLASNGEAPLPDAIVTGFRLVFQH